MTMVVVRDTNNNSVPLQEYMMKIDALIQILEEKNVLSKEEIQNIVESKKVMQRLVSNV